MSRKDIRRFEIWLARDCFGKDGYRPVIVLSDGAENRIVTVIPLTSDRESTQLATHIILSGHGLAVPSRALCEQLRTVRRNTLIRCMGYVHEPFERLALAHAAAAHLGLLNLPV